MSTFLTDREPKEKEPLSLETVCQLAVGAASMCWENVGDAGVFDVSKAKSVADALVAEIRERFNPGEKQPSYVDGVGGKKIQE